MSNAALSGEAVCAVIVTYNPDPDRLREILKALADTVARTVIVDNASEEIEEGALRASFPTLILKRLPENKGVGAAQNEGIALARTFGHHYVLLLDQDSLPQHGTVAALLSALTRMRAQGFAVGCVGSRFASRNSATLSRFTRMGWLRAVPVQCVDTTSVVECDFVMSSGSLIPMTVLDEVGGLEEQLFIDQVDTEWCLRARAKGYQVFGACNAILEHRLGEGQGRVWLGRWRRLPRHKPFRYYYIFRNTILLCRRNYVPLRYAMFYFTWLIGLFLTFGLLARPRNGELSMMWKGLLHGLRGITGRLRP